MALTRFLLLSLLCMLASPSLLQAAEGDRVLAERARAAQAMSLQYMAADLLDELVYRWTQNPPLKSNASRVVVMPIAAPIGLNSQMNVFLENHVFSLLTKNPQSGIRPVYCGPCLTMTSYSRSDHTVIGRGADIPQLGESLKEQADAAVYISLEAEGSQLVLRSFIVALGDHRILNAESIATDSAHPPLLRTSARLTSQDQTRQDYVGILEGRKRFSVLAGVRTNFVNAETDALVTAPFVWGYFGFETFTNERKKWLADIQYAAAYLESQYSAWQVSSRIYRHLFNDSVDLVSPDIYVSAGFTYWEVKGAAATLFKKNKDQTVNDIVSSVLQRKEKPKAQNLGLVLGLEARIAEFVRAGFILESYGNQQDNENFKGSFHSYGFEFGVTL